MIELEHVQKLYGEGATEVTALRDVSLRIERGEFVAVVGPSGSGKSTLLNLIGCLDRPSAGRCLLFGNDVSTMSDAEVSALRSRSLGFVFQLFNLVPEFTLRENVELPLVYAGVRRERSVLTDNALELVGLADRADHRAGVLSGGEQQRAAIARALINDPEVLLTDEPTGSIDSASSQAVLRMLDRLHRQGRTVVIVTHNLEVAAVARRVVRLEAGTIVGDTGEAATPEPPPQHVTPPRAILQPPPLAAPRVADGRP